MWTRLRKLEADQKKLKREVENLTLIIDELQWRLNKPSKFKKGDHVLFKTSDNNMGEGFIESSTYYSPFAWKYLIKKTSDDGDVHRFERLEGKLILADSVKFLCKDK